MNILGRTCTVLCSPRHKPSHIPTEVLIVPAEGDRMLGLLQLTFELEKHVEWVHSAHKEKYEKLVAAGRKRKGDTFAGNVQNKLTQPQIEATIRSANIVTQQQVNTTVVNFVIGALMPLSVVDVQEFKDLITTLQPNRHAMSRSTLRGLIDAEASMMKVKQLKLVEMLKKQDFVAMTTDCWMTGELFEHLVLLKKNKMLWTLDDDNDMHDY